MENKNINKMNMENIVDGESLKILEQVAIDENVVKSNRIKESIENIERYVSYKKVTKFISEKATELKEINENPKEKFKSSLKEE